jgi:Cu-Zn family superoxide dismutase
LFYKDKFLNPKESIMKKVSEFPTRSLLLLFTCAMLATACNNSPNSSDSSEEKKEAMPETKMAEATIAGTVSDTTVNGSAKFSQEGDGKVKMDIELSIPKMASHSVAVHIHEHGDCGDAGNSSHGHWNPTNKQHGKWGTGEFHLGDIGNIELDATGKGTYSLETDLWTIGGDAQTDILSKAIIVHSGMDDFTSQPAGNAGSRIGCGVIQKK